MLKCRVCQLFERFRLFDNGAVVALGNYTPLLLLLVLTDHNVKVRYVRCFLPFLGRLLLKERYHTV